MQVTLPCLFNSLMGWPYNESMPTYIDVNSVLKVGRIMAKVEFFNRLGECLMDEGVIYL